MATENPVQRCAIYTRKSSEEGLEQEFNSLHAQRKLPRRTSNPNGTKAGSWWTIIMTMVASQGATWTALL